MLRNRTLFALMLCLLPISASAQNNWWNANINYRVPLTVETVGGTAQSQSVTVGVNFTSTLQAVSNRRPVNADALRVVEVDSAGKVIDDNVDTQFERAANMESSLYRTGLLEDQDVRYALAYALFSSRRFADANKHLDHLKNAELFRKGTELRRLMEVCKTEPWQCT